MRHNKKFNHLGRQASHRKAMLANMASSLIQWKRITTTLAKAKALQMFIDPIITKSKAANNAVITTAMKTVKEVQTDGTVVKVQKKINLNSSTPARRLAFSSLRSKDAVKELFGVVAPKIADRPGGYTRVLKLGFRQGDAAEMAVIELVDFNESAIGTSAKKDAKKTVRRSRKKSDAPATDEVKAEKPAKPKAAKKTTEATEKPAKPKATKKAKEDTAE